MFDTFIQKYGMMTLGAIGAIAVDVAFVPESIKESSNKRDWFTRKLYVITAGAVVGAFVEVLAGNR